jgi:hypothetical protein
MGNSYFFGWLALRKRITLKTQNFICYQYYKGSTGERKGGFGLGVAEDRVKWRAVSNKIMNLRIA